MKSFGFNPKDFTLHPYILKPLNPYTPNEPEPTGLKLLRLFTQSYIVVKDYCSKKFVTLKFDVPSQQWFKNAFT